MQFLSLKVGSPNLNFTEDPPAIVVDFTFPQPAQSAFAMLEGFDFNFEAPDRQLERIECGLDTHFGAGDQSGTVIVKFAFSDDSTSLFSSNLISAELKFLVVGF